MADTRDSTINENLSLLDEAKIQAQVLVPVLRALRSELGEEKAKQLVRTALITLTYISFFLCMSGPSFAADLSDLQAEADIRKLTNCYALGTDALGAGNLQQGKELYQNCFTPDAPIAAFFPDGQGNERKGPDAWADFVYGLFQDNKYTATQHLIGTITINVNGGTATMSSYLHATHLRPNGSIDVANGTYEDEVIKTEQGWRIRTRTLKLITFLNLAPASSSDK